MSDEYSPLKKFVIVIGASVLFWAAIIVGVTGW